MKRKIYDVLMNSFKNLYCYKVYFNFYFFVFVLFIKFWAKIFNKLRYKKTNLISKDLYDTLINFSKVK